MVYFVITPSFEFLHDEPGMDSASHHPRETCHVAEVKQDSRPARSDPRIRCSLRSHQRRGTWLPPWSSVVWCEWLGTRRLGWRRPGLGRWLGRRLGRWRLGQRRLGGRRLGRLRLLLSSLGSAASAAVLLLRWLGRRRLGQRRLGRRRLGRRWLVILIKEAGCRTHNCIRLRFPSGAFVPWRFRHRGKVVEIEVEGSLIANEAGLLVKAALDGAGVLYVLQEFAAPMIATGQWSPCSKPGYPRRPRDFS
jgi:hypothetical protein